MGCEVTAIAPPTLLPARPEVLGADHVSRTTSTRCSPSSTSCTCCASSASASRARRTPACASTTCSTASPKERDTPHEARRHRLPSRPHQPRRRAGLLHGRPPGAFGHSRPGLCRHTAPAWPPCTCCLEGAKMALLLKNAHVIDPQVGLNETCRHPHPRRARSSRSARAFPWRRASSATWPARSSSRAWWICMCICASRASSRRKTSPAARRAAAHGGFTAVCCHAQHQPGRRQRRRRRVREVHRAPQAGKCRVHVSGSCSQGLKGETLSEMGDMAAHGAVAFTDDGRGMQAAGMMRRVMDYASQFGRVVMSHCQDEDLVGDGQVNEGVVSTRLGLAGLAGRRRGAPDRSRHRPVPPHRLPCCTSSTSPPRAALTCVRAAKAEGLPVTCEVTPHHLFLTEDTIGDDYSTALKVNPPLRTAADAEAAHRRRDRRHRRRHRHRPCPARRLGRRTASSSWRRSA